MFILKMNLAENIGHRDFTFYKIFSINEYEKTEFK